MLSCPCWRRPAAGTLALATLLASAAGAEAAVTVTNAKIEGGKLVVSGTASSGAQLRLDGQEGGAFNARAGADGSFGFSLVYHPGDCVVTVEALVPPYLTAGEAAEALVANCGPAGVTAKGAWVEAAAYVRNDLVTHEGSTWRARRNNLGDTPAAGADWEVFAAAGEDGAAGESASASSSSMRVEPTGPAGGDLTGNYPNPQIRNQIIVSSNLVDGAITTPKINDGAVDSAKIENNSIRSVDILNNTIIGGDIADSAITSADVAPNTLTADDIANDAVTSAEIADGAVTSAKVLDDTVVGGGLAATDLAANSVGASEIATDAVNATEIADNSIDSGEIVDFGLSNQDVGVLFAQVNADGTLANSSGRGATSSRIALGLYQVDFARNVSVCAPIATQGEAGAGAAPGAITGATDRSGNAEAFFVTTRNSANASVDRAFHLVVVC